MTIESFKMITATEAQSPITIIMGLMKKLFNAIRIAFDIGREKLIPSKTMNGTNKTKKN